jgi:hypothetical protein
MNLLLYFLDVVGASELGGDAAIVAECLPPNNLW